MISKVVEKVIAKGYLSLDTEKKIKTLFQGNCNTQDLDALVSLQNAVSTGLVKREAIQSQKSKKVFN